MRASQHLLIMALVLLPVIVPAVSAEAAHVARFNVTVPTLWVEAEPGYGIIVSPTLSVPAFVKPGSGFEILLARDVSVKDIAIDDGYGHVYHLEFSVADGVITASVPDDAKPGLYDLVVITDNGAYGMPHAVVVAKPEQYREIVVIHVTDRHFGVINPNGRSAASYDLAADLLALGLPNNTIVFDTGDIADTSKPQEYKDSLLADTLLNKPMITIPGNHDHVGGSKNYAKYRGPWNYTLSILGMYRVIGIDSGFEGYIDTSQAQWAYRVLTSSSEPVKIVMFHHPHFTHMFGDVPWNFSLDSWEELYDLLLSKKPGSSYSYIYGSWLANTDALKTLVKGIFEAQAKRILVLSGHVHLDSYAEVHRPDGSTINYVVTVATGGSVRRGDYHGFRVIKLSSNGTIEFYGDGGFNTRHASFSLEDVKASIVFTDKAASTILEFGEHVPARSLMEKTVVAVPLPQSWAGKTVGVELEGLNAYQLRCTPLGCVLYAYRDSPPEPGARYRATVYTVPDREPPSIRIVSVTPRKPVQGQPVTIVARVSDDAWGVAGVEVTLAYPGGEMQLVPSVLGSRIKIVVPPVNASKATVAITAVDAAGHSQTKEVVVEYNPPATTATNTNTATETATTATPATTTTTRTTTEELTATTTETSAATETKTTRTEAATATAEAGTSPAINTETVATAAATGEGGQTAGVAAEQSGGPPTLLIVGVAVVAAVAYLAVMARR